MPKELGKFSYNHAPRRQPSSYGYKHCIIGAILQKHPSSNVFTFCCIQSRHPAQG